jgi:ketosteroid isomerase-like protein
MSIKFYNPFLCVLVAFLAPGCQRNQFDDEARVKLVVYKIIEADNQSDLEKVISFYDSTATLMPPGKPVIRGRAAIRNNYQELFKRDRLQLKIEIEEVGISGNWAWISGL